MYSRAVVLRMVALVVALSLTAISTSAIARESRAAGAHSQDCPTVQTLRRMGRLTAATSLIDGIRKVE